MTERPNYMDEIPALAERIVRKVLEYGYKPGERDIGDGRSAAYFVDHAINHEELWDVHDTSELHLRHALCDIAIALYLEGE